MTNTTRYPLCTIRDPQRRAPFPLFRLYRQRTNPRIGGSISSQLPASVDLRRYIPPVDNQGELACGTAHAICAAIQYEDPLFRPSRLFLYYNELVVEGDTREDQGKWITDGLHSLMRQGVCSEDEWPYHSFQCDIQPPNSCYASASMKYSVYTLPNDITSMKKSLVAGFPFLVSIRLFQSMESATVTRTGEAPMPGPLEAPLGGHAVLCVGFNDRTGRWIMRNSWGSRWGDKGYFTLPYRYLIDSHLASDLWVITGLE